MFIDLDINKKFEFKIYVYYTFENNVLKVILISLKLIFKSFRLSFIFNYNSLK